jgi:hypothetical protein
MKTMTYTGSRRIINQERIFIQPLKPSTILRRFQRYIETSDWDEQISRKQPFIDNLCWGVVILSGLAISPFIVASFLK